MSNRPKSERLRLWMDSPKYSNNELTQDRSLRTIAGFAKKLFYFALNKEQVHLMQELNEAFLSLMKFKPNLKVELYIRYYVQNHNYFSISQEQTQEIQSIGPIKVMIFKGNAPFQDVTEAGPAGIAINYFEDFAAKTGMQYEYVIANSYQEGIQLMKQGAVDIAACISTDLTSQQLNGFQFTMPYYTGVIIPVYPANAERVNLAQLSFSQNTQNSMQEIQIRRIPGARLENSSLQYYLRKNKLYDNLAIEWADRKDIGYCVGVSDKLPPNLNCVMIALTHAKKNNDDTDLCMYDEKLHEQEQLRQYMEAHMHKALQNQEFVVYLQPEKNLCTGLFDGAEALVRWQTKDRGLLFPDTFIPLFEENGFCKKLDLYMIEQACKILRQWIDEGLSPITISVNQTKALFVSDDYVEQLKSITNRYQVPPQYIVLEILEGLSFENIDGLNAQIEALGKAGFLVSLDDFGAGYSSLNTLGKLKIRKVKLDRMFLMDVQKGNYESQKDVMESIFAMAKKLGIETVAEGVETLDDETLVSSMGCNFGQGYYYSKPIPVKNYEEEFL